jgi:hypothetical protein
MIWNSNNWASASQNRKNQYLKIDNYQKCSNDFKKIYFNYSCLNEQLFKHREKETGLMIR